MPSTGTDHSTSDLITPTTTTRNSLSLCTPVPIPFSEEHHQCEANSRHTSVINLESVVTAAAADLKEQSAVSEPKPKKKCLSKEFFTCFALSSIVIGLPVAIIIVLINLPRLSTRRDTRQQHYILLAFGFPFSLVVTVSIAYAIFRLVIRIRSGPNHAKLLRSRMSWRRFSRRLRGLSNSGGQYNRNRPHAHHYRHGHHFAEQAAHIASSEHLKSPDNNLDAISDLEECTSCEGSQNAINEEPKLYSLVAEVMSKQHFPARKGSQLHQVFPETQSPARSIAHLNVDMCYDASGLSRFGLPDQRRASNPPLV